MFLEVGVPLTEGATTALPPTKEEIEKLLAIASRYAGPKGNLQFPLDEPMPFDLIERIVNLRVKQDSEKAAAKRKKK